METTGPDGPDPRRARVLAELAALFPASSVRAKAVDGLVDLVLDAPPQERLRVLTGRIRDAATMTLWYRRHRDLALRQLRAEGASLDAVAVALGVSKTRAQQLCRRLDGTVEPVPDRAGVLDELAGAIPLDEAQPALLDALTTMVTEGPPAERAAAITRRMATAGRIVQWYSGYRDEAVAELAADGATATDLGALLGVSPTWSRALLRRVVTDRAA